MNVHSQKDLPLIHNVVAYMHLLKLRLELMRGGVIINSEPTNAESGSASVPKPPQPLGRTTYLTTPPIDETKINKFNAPLQFWESEFNVGSVFRRMALDIL
ncbi:hypothetical protein V565_129680, partial [Rhizoctonia solani 123E]